MIAEPMEKSVGIRSHAGGGERHQRAYGGGLAFQGQLLHLRAVHVGVESGVILHQVAASNRDCRRGSAHLQGDGWRDRDRGVHLDIDGERCKARRVRHQMIGGAG